MKKITISSSLRFIDLIKKTIEDFGKIGIEASFPNLDTEFDEGEITPQIMKKLQQDHFRAIDKSECVYVLNPKGYIGTMVKVEIGYAVGSGKPVYYSEKTGSVELDVIAKKVIGTDELEKFEEE